MTGQQDVGILFQNASIPFLLPSSNIIFHFLKAPGCVNSQRQTMNDRWEEKFYPFQLLNWECLDNASILLDKPNYLQKYQ